MCFAQEASLKPAVRMEDELTYAVRPQDTEKLWSFLVNRFKADVTIDGMQFRTVQSIEHFVDSYFDTADRKLIKQWAGLRFRHRIGERGEVKELIQLKVTPRSTDDVRGVLRNEIKFVPAIGVGGSGEFPTSDLLTSFLKGADIERFAQNMSLLGVRPEDLRFLLKINQQRRRIYFRQGDKQFFTLTLDFFKGSKNWSQTQLAQLEVEIGENLFTNATAEERLKYLEIQHKLLAVVKSKFKLEQNQMPKVVQMYEILSSKSFFSKIIMTFGEAVPIFFIVFAALLLYLLLSFLRLRQNTALN